MREMDYITQRPDLDLQAFFKAKGIRLSSSDTKVDDPTKPTKFAPPPKDSAWVAIPDNDDDRIEEN